MIAEQFLQLRAEIENALLQLLQLETEMRREKTHVSTLQGLLTNLREPLLFVVVGEVKAGKSSLLNAIFGQEFAKVDVLPATDRIYVFKYGEQDRVVEINPRLTERYMPIAFLRDFNIVDTPGTNTMVTEHQTITEEFVPRADLVLFVFSVTNPWTQSAWELLHFVQKKWLKNVVFVLQQSDLRAEAEIEVIERHLRETALQKLGFTPPIFAVSAKKALLAKTTGADKERLWKESGFQPLEEQINQIVSGAEERMLKLQSILRSGRVVLEEAGEEVHHSLDLVIRDEASLTRVQKVVEVRREQTLRQVAGFVRGVEQACRESSLRAVKFLGKKLSFWQTWKLVLGQKDWQQEVQTELETNLRGAVQPQMERAVELLETDLRTLWPQLQDAIEANFISEVKSRVTRAIPDFARQRRELLQSIQLSLAERASTRAAEEQITVMLTETSTWLRLPAGIAAAGALAFVISAMVHAAVVDVTGALALSSAALGSILALTRRRKIINAYRENLEEKCRELVRTVEDNLIQAIDLFYREITLTFQPLEDFCRVQRELQQPWVKRVEELRETFEALNGRLGHAS